MYIALPKDLHASIACGTLCLIDIMLHLSHKFQNWDKENHNLAINMLIANAVFVSIEVTHSRSLSQQTTNHTRLGMNNDNAPLYF